MARNIFGWSYPPGAANDPNAPYNQDDDGPCAVCCNDVTDCVCPECPVCGSMGDPKCYSEPHGLKLIREQAISRAECSARIAKQNCIEAALIVAYLKSGGEFSNDLDDHPDPWA